MQSLIRSDATMSSPVGGAFEAIQSGRDVNHHAVRTGRDVLLGL